MTVSNQDQKTWKEVQAKLAPWRLLWLKHEAPGMSPHNEVDLEYVCTSGETFWLMLERPVVVYKMLWSRDLNQSGPIFLAKIRYKKDGTFPTPQWVELWGGYDVGYWSLEEVMDAKKYYFRWLVDYEGPPIDSQR